MVTGDSYIKLSRETARIAWGELARFFAQGRVLHVADGLDLIAVAAAMADDDTASVAHWREEGALAAVSDEVAGAWFESEASVWAVAVAPFVLVQRER